MQRAPLFWSLAGVNKESHFFWYKKLPGYCNVKVSTSHSDISCPSPQHGPNLLPDVEWVLVPGFQQTPTWGSSALPPHLQWAWSLLQMGFLGGPFMALGGLLPTGPGHAPEPAPAPRDWAFAVTSLPPSLTQGCPFRDAGFPPACPTTQGHQLGWSLSPQAGERAKL